MRSSRMPISLPIAAVDPEHVYEVYLALRGRSDGVLVEGPSGLLAPIGWNRTTADLASALGLPLVIVCRPGRGTINHAARGGFSLTTKSSSDVVPVAPSFPKSLTLSWFLSKTTH